MSPAFSFGDAVSQRSSRFGLHVRRSAVALRRARHRKRPARVRGTRDANSLASAAVSADRGPWGASLPTSLNAGTMAAALGRATPRAANRAEANVSADGQKSTSRIRTCDVVASAQAAFRKALTG